MGHSAGDVLPYCPEQLRGVDGTSPHASVLQCRPGSLLWKLHCAGPGASGSWLPSAQHAGLSHHQGRECWAGSPPTGTAPRASLSCGPRPRSSFPKSLLAGPQIGTARQHTSTHVITWGRRADTWTSAGPCYTTVFGLQLAPPARERKTCYTVSSLDRRLFSS